MDAAPWDPGAAPADHADARPAVPRRRRPLGVTTAALVYIVLGSHALMFGAYLAAEGPAAAPAVPYGGAGFVQAYGLALLGIAVPLFAIGAGLAWGKPWARWAVLLAVPLHIVGPPFQLGGVVFAALVNVYLWGAPASRAWLGSEDEDAAPPPPRGTED